MKKKVLILLLIASALVTVSCEKDKTDLPIEYKFVLLDTLGNEKTEFNQGENIIFSFQIINKSSEDLYLEKFLPNDEFFRVYNLNTDEGTLDNGKPYEHLFCEFIAALRVPANDTFKVVIPWYKNSKYTDGYIGCPLETYHSNVGMLNFGNYYTEFSQSFKIGDIQTEEKHFEINFTIK